MEMSHSKRVWLSYGRCMLNICSGRVTMGSNHGDGLTRYCVVQDEAHGTPDKHAGAE